MSTRRSSSSSPISLRILFVISFATSCNFLLLHLFDGREPIALLPHTCNIDAFLTINLTNKILLDTFPLLVYFEVYIYYVKYN